jgi:type IV pilus assembly protein PilB
MAAKFGQMLSRFVPMSEHDIHEILDEQAVCRRKFGEIALSWNLCRPDHVWRAWCAQLAQQPQYVDLHEIGVDTQAITAITYSIAREYCVLPLRLLDDELVVATSEAFHDRALQLLPEALKRNVRFVIADEAAVLAAIQLNYARFAAHTN